MNFLQTSSDLQSSGLRQQEAGHRQAGSLVLPLKQLQKGTETQRPRQQELKEEPVLRQQAWQRDSNPTRQPRGRTRPVTGEIWLPSSLRDASQTAGKGEGSREMPNGRGRLGAGALQGNPMCGTNGADQEKGWCWQ